MNKEFISYLKNLNTINMKSVRTIHNIDELKDIHPKFLDNFTQPVLFKGGCSDMKATKKWSVDYLKTHFNNVRLIM